MSTAVQDDDLLIIADDEQDDSNDTIEFSFDDDSASDTPTHTAETETPKVEETEVSSDIKLNLSAENTETDTQSLETSLLESSETESSDLWIDLMGSETPSLETDSWNQDVVETKDSADEEFTLNFGDEAIESVEETSEVEETQAATSDLGTLSLEDDSTAISGDDATWDDGSMNDILSATIAKLAARKTVIAGEKEAKLTHESEIKDQIKALQDEHTAIEAELTILDSESSNITANISKLENMKLDPVKDHNSKRAKK